MLKNQREDLRHLSIATLASEQVALQASEAVRHLDEGSPITQGTWLALDHGEVMPPVIDRLPRQTVGSRDDSVMLTQDLPLVLTQDLPLGDDDDLLWVGSQADRLVGERSGHAVAIAFELNEAGRRNALGVFDQKDGPVA